MKRIRLFITVSLVALVVPFAVSSLSAKENGKEKQKEEKSVSTGSIRPAGKVKDTELPALAKISFDDALKAARTAVPGNVIKAELEVEDGSLIYSFEIVGADKKVTEVEIDAGNGKVLAIDND
jgi:uncharacterized membrane protein YkoI